MKVFISWSGELSKKVAQAIQKFMPKILDEFDPYVSSISIEAGEKWLDSIITNLEQSDFGIICLTKSNLQAPWLMFEAGALSQKMGGKGLVAPIVIDVVPKSIDTPLSIFQIKSIDKDDFYQVMLSAFNNCNQTIKKENQFEEAFNKWWDDFETEISDIINLAREQEPIETINDGLLNDECKANYIVADIRAKQPLIREVSSDTSDLFFILLSVLDCPESRKIIEKIKGDFSNIEIEAMYDLQGNWDLLVKFRCIDDPGDFFETITSILEEENMMNPPEEGKFSARKLIDFRAQSLGVSGIMTPKDKEEIQYSLLPDGDHYRRYRAKRSFIIVETNGLRKKGMQWKKFLKLLKDNISDTSGAKIIESVIVSDDELVFELFSNCAQSSFMDYLNADLEKALTPFELQKYSLSCYGYDESGLLNEDTKNEVLK